MKEDNYCKDFTFSPIFKPVNLSKIAYNITLNIFSNTPGDMSRKKKIQLLRNVLNFFLVH